MKPLRKPSSQDAETEHCLTLGQKKRGLVDVTVERSSWPTYKEFLSLLPLHQRHSIPTGTLNLVDRLKFCLISATWVNSHVLPTQMDKLWPWSSKTKQWSALGVQHDLVFQKINSSTLNSLKCLTKGRDLLTIRTWSRPIVMTVRFTVRRSWTMISWMWW